MIDATTKAVVETISDGAVALLEYYYAPTKNFDALARQGLTWSYVSIVTSHQNATCPSMDLASSFGAG